MATISENNGDAGATPENTSYSIALGDVFQGTLESVDDRDLIQIELSADTIYDIRLHSDAAPAKLDDHEKIIRVVLHDAEGNSIVSGVGIAYGSLVIHQPPVSGTYYLEVLSPFKGVSGDYELSVVENTIPTGTYDEIADYLTEGYWQWKSDGDRSGAAFNVGPGGTLTADITALSEEVQQLARWALEAWTNVTGIRFELVDDENADILFSNEDDDFPTGGFASSDGVIISSRVNLPEKFSPVDVRTTYQSIGTIIHEIGHALGLGHPGQYPSYDDNVVTVFGFENLFLIDSRQTTIMSYIKYSNTYINASPATAVTPMIADIIAIQNLYGVPTDINVGDTVYGYQSNVGGYLGELFRQWVGGGDSVLNDPVSLTLYDNGGIDTLDLRTDTRDQRVDLRAEGISDVFGLTGNLVIARDTLIENFIAGSGNDEVIGNAAVNRLEGQAGDDELRGNDGDDVLEGGAGADRLYGGVGLDWASYSSSDTGVTVKLGAGTYAGGHAQGDTLVGIENVRGSAHADVLEGDDGANHLDGLAGNDVLRGHGGDDSLSGNNGDDKLEGGPGADRLDGGTGTDELYYGGSDAGVTVNLTDGTGTGGHAEGDTVIDVENVTGSAHADVLAGDDSANRLDGSGGDDELRGHGGNDVLEGGAGEDELDGGADVDWVSYGGSDAGITIKLHDNTIEGGHAQGDSLVDIENVRGSAHPDVLEGDGSANQLDGLAGDDDLRGHGGDDVLEGGAGEDELDGGAGMDWVSYESSDAGITIRFLDETIEGGHAQGDTWVDIEYVMGSAHADVLEGNDDANQFDGLAGNDALRGYGGADTLAGGAGADKLVGDDGEDSLSGNGDNDILEGGLGADRLDGGEGSDWSLYDKSDAGVTVDLGLATGQMGGHAQGDVITAIENVRGSDYSDKLYGNDSANILDGGSEADTLDGRGGADWASYERSDTGVTVKLREGTGENGHAQGDVLVDIENLRGSGFRDVLGGDNTANHLEGGGGDDDLWGSGGDDVLEGGAGADRLFGGIGLDWASYSNSDTGVTVKLGVGTIEGGHAQGDTFTDIENVRGSAHADILEGDDGANRLDGLAGDDMLDGGGGADVLDGGTGTDGITYGGSDAGVTVNLTEGTGTGGHAEGDTITNVENVTGTDYADVLSGDGVANSLQGLDGDDELQGNDGHDVLEGGAGADQLHGGAGTDRVSYQGSDAGVTINLAYGTSEGGHAEGDVLTSIENVTGSDHNDSLRGNDEDNSLAGRDGSDWLYGGDGADRLDGGEGDDWIRYWGSDAGITVNLEEGTSGGGDAEGDVIIDIENVTGSDYADVLIGSDGNNSLYGNGGNDELQGADGDDRLNGGDGADRLDGGEGEDWLYGGDGADRLDGGEGEDRIQYWGSDAGITVNLEEGTSGGGDAEGDVIIDIENVTGSDHADVLIGSDGNNSLYGNGGNDELQGADGDDRLNGGDGADRLDGGEGGDWLDGGDGADRLDGGEGDDWLNGGDGADRLDGGEGEDRIQYWGSDAGITVNLEEGTGEGGDAEGDVIIDIENVTGSDHADVLIGSDGNNSLYGNDGNDELQGTDGDDWLNGGDGADRLDGGEGEDRLNGGDGADRLDGSEGDDWLNGGDGADRLDGGEGDDWIQYWDSDAGVTVNLEEGTGEGGDAEGDVIIDVERVTGSDHADVLIGDGNKNSLSGQGGDDVLRGSGGDDFLLGYSGADRLEGGSGTDTLYGNDGATADESIDTFVFDAGHGDDYIYGFTDNEDLIDLSAFNLSGFDDLTISSNSNGVKIDLSDYGGGTILLYQFDINDLDAADFLF